jgi:hypothetical protein
MFTCILDACRIAAGATAIGLDLEGWEDEPTIRRICQRGIEKRGHRAASLV